jgi:hypothetical protein
VTGRGSAVLHTLDPAQDDNKGTLDCHKRAIFGRRHQESAGRTRIDMMGDAGIVRLLARRCDGMGMQPSRRMRLWVLELFLDMDFQIWQVGRYGRVR